MTYPLRSFNEDDPAPVLTVSRFCGKCGRVTEWARDPDHRLRCVRFRNDEPCLYDNVAPLTDSEMAVLAAHVGGTESGRAYFFT